MISEAEIRIEANVGVTLYVYVWRKMVSRMSSGMDYTSMYNDLKIIEGNLTCIFWAYNNTFGRGLSEIDEVEDIYALIKSIVDRLHAYENKYIRSSASDVPVLMYVTLDGSPGASGSCTLLRDILVSGVNVGGYASGMIISKGTDFTTFVETLMQNITPPTYYLPYLLATPDPDEANAYLEVGSIFVDSTTFEYVKKDAGLPNKWTAYRRLAGEDFAVIQQVKTTNTTYIHEHPDSQLIELMSENDYLEIKVDVNYDEGIKTKINSLGLVDPTGYITAGVATKLFKYMARYPAYILFSVGQITVWNETLRSSAHVEMIITDELTMSGAKTTETLEYYFSVLVPPGYEIDIDNSVMWPDNSNDHIFDNHPYGSLRDITVAIGNTNINADKTDYVYKIYDFRVTAPFEKGDDYNIIIKKS